MFSGDLMWFGHLLSSHRILPPGRFSVGWITWALSGPKQQKRPEADGPCAEDQDLEKSSSPFVLQPAAALVPYRAKACLHELVFAMAETRHVSLSPWSSGSLTYGRLVDQTTKLPSCLEALGLGAARTSPWSQSGAWLWWSVFSVLRRWAAWLFLAILRARGRGKQIA